MLNIDAILSREPASHNAAPENVVGETFLAYDWQPTKINSRINSKILPKFFLQLTLSKISTISLRFFGELDFFAMNIRK